MADAAPIRIALFVAIAENGVIGRDGGLPWRLSTDLKLFRQHTMGKPLIMGRRTFASLGKPLDGRDNIVITRAREFAAAGAIVVHALEDALARARDLAERRGTDEIVVIGGGTIYGQALPLANRIYVTRVSAAVAGDVTFPPIDWSKWATSSSQVYDAGPRDAHGFTFSVMERITGSVGTV